MYFHLHALRQVGRVGKVGLDGRLGMVRASIRVWVLRRPVVLVHPARTACSVGLCVGVRHTWQTTTALPTEVLHPSCCARRRRTRHLGLAGACPCSTWVISPFVLGAGLLQNES